MGYHFREQDSFVRIVELTPAMRKQIEATIEHLLSVLDQFDGDENLEEDDPAEEGGDTEPSLGWADMQARYDFYGVGDRHHVGLGYDRELDTVDDEDGGETEPSLGAPERHPSSLEFAPLGVVCREPGPLRHVREKSQECWADGLRGDHEREEENEYGGDVLDEPHDDERVDDEQDHRDCEFA